MKAKSKLQVALAMLALLSAGASQAQTANPLTGGARLHYGIIKGYVLRAAAKMPEEMRLKGIVPPSSEPPFGT